MDSLSKDDAINTLRQMDEKLAELTRYPSQSWVRVLAGEILSESRALSLRLSENKMRTPKSDRPGVEL